MTTLGKIIGGGLPVGAYGGKKEIMECVAPVGPVYQAGTLSGNPLAVNAGIATLEILKAPGFYAKLESKASALQEGITTAAKDAGVSTQCNRIGSMMTTFFTSEAVFDYTSAKTSDTGLYARYFNEMLQRGVYFAPSQFEAAFVSSAHTDDDISHTIDAARKVFGLLK
jgi:glutamate-1-semialdehyde 2,1-aminomutase